MVKRHAETEDSIRQLDGILAELIRTATATELPAADSRVLAFISERRVRVVREEQLEDRRSSE